MHGCTDAWMDGWRPAGSGPEEWKDGWDGTDRRMDLRNVGGMDAWKSPCPSGTLP